MRLQGGKGGRVVRWQGGKDGREQGGGMGSRFSCMAAEMERHFLDLPQAVKNRVGCGNVQSL